MSKTIAAVQAQDGRIIPAQAQAQEAAQEAAQVQAQAIKQEGIAMTTINEQAQAQAQAQAQDKPEFVGTVYRTASIDYLIITAEYADFKTKTFASKQVYYFGDINDSDDKILRTICKETGKVFQNISAKQVVSRLYRITTMKYVAFGEDMGEARERKTK